jgi:hypothetical protein
MPAAITTVFHDQISRCRSCGSRIAWLRGRSGKPYPVNLLNTSAQGGRARVNDFHNCRNTGEPGDAQTQATERAAAVAEARMEHKVQPPSITAGTLQARGVSPAPTLAEVTAIRRTVSQAMDLYCVAWSRYAVEGKGMDPQTATSQYWHQMRVLINDQIDGVLSGYSIINGTPKQPRPVADNELDPPADPGSWMVPQDAVVASHAPASASLDAVVDATHSRQIDDTLSPDYAGGPEPVPAGWPSDDDVPF